jgi:hypothetical protein
MKYLRQLTSWISNRPSAVFAWIGLCMVGIGAAMVYLPAGFIGAGLLLFIESVGWLERKST